MTQPNVILIFTDNQQAATLGCYGNPEVHTPNIDRLAADGVLFQNAFCANAFCSPCRASALTGMLPSQHGVHSWIDDRNMHDWPQGWHALGDLTTLPEVMQATGYTTGLFGKYHLGDPTTPAPGWDNWVTMADGHVRSFYDNRIFDNGDTYAQPGHSVDFFTGKMLDFVADVNGPYFAYVPLPAPYGHWPATNDAMRNRHADRYDTCPMDTVPRCALSREAVAGYDRVKSESGKGLDFSMLMRAPNDLATLRNYYSQITMIDDAVGRIAAAAPDALIIFTTDHGLSLGHHGFWGHGAATYPSNLHYAAHSIPLIVKDPRGGIDGAKSDLFVSNVDLFSTILDYAGCAADPSLPSRSFAAVLRGEYPTDWGADEVYAEQEETRVLRTPDWTYFKRFNASGAPDFPNALFRVSDGPQEDINLAERPEFAQVTADLDARIDSYFAVHALPESDLWRGGKPVQNSMLKAYWREIWGADWEPVYKYEERRLI
ncbi:MAG: sulfatase-like hydrolase/transferase [Pseudomonadota bacterium]